MTASSYLGVIALINQSDHAIHFMKDKITVNDLGYSPFHENLHRSCRGCQKSNILGLSRLQKILAPKFSFRDYWHILHVVGNILLHNDVNKWKHFPRYWPFVRGIHRSSVISPHKGHWRGVLIFSLICDWINSWVNTREASVWGVIAIIMTSL